jgi:phosphoglycolate phosphatase-like HAD superfamily hydrolase
VSSFNGTFGNIKAIVFDFDGVILESADIKTEAFLELFAEYPQLRPAILQYHLENLGLSRYDKFAWIYRELLDRPFTAADREQLGCDFSAIVLDKILACPFVPGAREALETLAGRYSLFVASGTPQEELELIVRQRELKDYFVEVWGSPRQKTEIIHGILEQHRLRPEETMMIGDGSSDYKAAGETNVFFVARNTPDQSQYWQELNVPYIMDDLRGLPLMFGNSDLLGS